MRPVIMLASAICASLLLLIIIKLLKNNKVEKFTIDQKRLSADDIRAFVINLERNENRRTKFSSNFELDIPFNVVMAVDGNRLDITYLVELGIVSAQVVRNIRLPMPSVDDVGSMGAIGCYLSHVKLWEKMLNDSTIGAMIVFEDDAIVPKTIRLNDIIQRINSLPSNWHVYMLGRPHTRLTTENVDNQLVKVTQFCGTHCYILSRLGVQWLVSNGNVFPIFKQIDAKMSSLTFKGLNIYMHPNMEFVGFDQYGYSDIQQINRGIIV